MESVDEVLRVEVEVPPERCAAAVREAAGMWGAEWDASGSAPRSGRLRLPVVAGLRHGLVTGDLRVDRAGSGSVLSFQPIESVYYLNTRAVVILAIAAVGALLTMLWPLFPESREMMTLAPLGAVLAISGWLLVVSRLTNSGPREFLDAAAELADDEGKLDGSG